MVSQNYNIQDKSNENEGNNVIPTITVHNIYFRIVPTSDFHTINFILLYHSYSCKQLLDSKQFFKK